MNELINYLSGIAEDAAIPGESNSLEKHDKRFHPSGYKEGSSCKFRDNHPELVNQQREKDNTDDLNGSGTSATVNGNGLQGGNETAAQKYMNRVNAKNSGAVQNPKKIQMDRLVKLHSMMQDDTGYRRAIDRDRQIKGKGYGEILVGPVAQEYLKKACQYIGCNPNDKDTMSTLKEMMNDVTYNAEPDDDEEYFNDIFGEDYSERSWNRFVKLYDTCGGEWKKAMAADKKKDKRYGERLTGPNAMAYVKTMCATLGVDENKKYDAVKRYLDEIYDNTVDEDDAEDYFYRSIFDEDVDEDVVQEHFERYLK